MYRTIAAAVLLAAPAAGYAQHLHTASRWDECSFQLDASLTQSAWRQFTGEAAVVTYFRPMTDARSMGRGKFEVSLLQWKTGIDAHDAAWNDTFVHPDSTHWLFEGSGLAFPGLTVRAGISERTDVGVYFTKNPNANYGFYGLQLQRQLTASADGSWSTAARASFMSLFGPEDVAFSAYGADLLVSRRYAALGHKVFVSPYAVVSGMLSRSHEKSAVVNLSDETVFGAQAVLGASAQWGKAKVAMEYGVARVPSFNLKIGFGSGIN
jgi:hypothetical protein